LLASVAPVTEHGRTTSIVATFVDLSRLAARERVEADFVADASHNLRTPLTVISTAVEILQSGAKDDPAERDRFLAHIEREVARMTSLTRSLLTLAVLDLGGEPLHMRETSAYDVLRTTAMAIEPSTSVRVIVDAPHELVVQTDPGLLEQAL